LWNKLPEDVKRELEDERFSGRTHHKKATYAKGCRGPLCRKAERDEAREDTRKAAVAAGREYKPAPPTPEQARDLELARIAVWHFHERGKQISQVPPQMRVCECGADVG
jgi:hypothetical protein